MVFKYRLGLKELKELDGQPKPVATCLRVSGHALSVTLSWSWRDPIPRATYSGLRVLLRSAIGSSYSLRIILIDYCNCRGSNYVCDVQYEEKTR